MIITNDEKSLRVFCEEVNPDEVGELIQKLENELTRSNNLGKSGIGLAASQIGIAKHIAIIRLGDINLNLVNAKIEKAYDPALFPQEGCLSFPGKLEDTIRYQEIYIKENLIYPAGFVATGLLAVACQHELDHLNSILFMDHAIKKPPVIKTKVKPNDPCICNSGKKFKKCCGR